MKKTYNIPLAEVFLIEDEALLAGVSGTEGDGTTNENDPSNIETGGSGNGGGANDAKRNSLFWLSDDDDE